MKKTIKAKIQELCPDVMELKFGCKVTFSNEEHFGYAMIVSEEDGRLRVLIAGEHNPLIERSAVKEILGSPITVAVVLRAIHKAWPDAKYACTSQGRFGHLDDLGHNNHLTVTWNLEKDNWDSQSVETQAFVGGLLGL